MQVLVYKSAIVNLAINPTTTAVAVGTKATLAPRLDGSVDIIVYLPSRWPFGFGTDRAVRAGTLDCRIADLLAPTLEKQSRLRVRVIEVEPAYIRRNAKPAVYISVWGPPDDLIPLHRPHPIFTPSRINEI